MIGKVFFWVTAVIVGLCLVGYLTWIGWFVFEVIQLELQGKEWP